MALVCTLKVDCNQQDPRTLLLVHVMYIPLLWVSNVCYRPIEIALELFSLKIPQVFVTEFFCNKEWTRSVATEVQPLHELEQFPLHARSE